jgi:hypothetical protein
MVFLFLYCFMLNQKPSGYINRLLVYKSGVPSRGGSSMRFERDSKKVKILLGTLASLGRILCIFRGLYIGPDMGHRETLVLLARTVGTLPQVLLTLVQFIFTTAIEADIFSRADLLSS